MQLRNTQNQIAEKTTDTVRQFFSLTNLKTTAVALPPIIEQKEILRRVNDLFAIADRIEKQYHIAKARVEKLTQSILAKAFRGELTAGWRQLNPDLISGESSAEALLEKIKVVKESLHSSKPERIAHGYNL